MNAKPDTLELTLQRVSVGKTATLGTLATPAGDFVTLEDPVRAHKIAAITAIPAGRYRITLRAAGGMHERYCRKFSWHRGMLWLRDVPNFQYVYLHIGNYPEDTEGCILVGTSTRGDWIYDSTRAYRALYRNLLPDLEASREVWIDVRNPPDYTPEADR